jgi:hypothetical protein
MKIAIMQPYLFPYIGYFQLIAAVDKFVIYDDVAFIKQGWINRNYILVNGQKHLFSIPMENLTSFKKINETKISAGLYDSWLAKFCRTISMSYKKAPHYSSVYPIVMDVLEKGRNAGDIAGLCRSGIRTIVEYLGLTTQFVDSSSLYGNGDLQSFNRVIDICKKEFATTYINAIGGQELYSEETFSKEGIDLRFLKPGDILYTQLEHAFIPHLSIIDVMMFNSKEEIGGYLKNFNLVQ